MSGSSCLPEPTVTNSKAAVVTEDNQTATAVYECLTGFSMAGNSRISCNKTLSVWQTAPYCSLVTRNVYVYNTTEVEDHEWWYQYLAAVLSLLVLSLIALVIWCWCWAPRSNGSDCCCCCCFRQRGRRLQDNHEHHNGNQQSNVFWIDSPQKHWINQGMGHYLCADSQNGSLTSLKQQRHHQQRMTREVGIEVSLDSTPPPSSLGQSRTVSRGLSSQKNISSSGTIFRHALAEVDTTDNRTTSSGTKVIPREAPVNRTVRPAKDPSKDGGRVWMPHSHSIRDINTSTK